MVQVQLGATVNQLNDADPIATFFGEDQGRYLVTLRPYDDIEAFTDFTNAIAAAGIFAPWIGNTGGDTLVLGDARPLPVADLKAAHEAWFPKYMAGEL